VMMPSCAVEGGDQRPPPNAVVDEPRLAPQLAV
jgi:hypothetical protein